MRFISKNHTFDMWGWSDRNAPDRGKVFLIHGRNEFLRKSMFEFLRSIGLYT